MGLFNPIFNARNPLTPGLPWPILCDMNRDEAVWAGRLICCPHVAPKEIKMFRILCEVSGGMTGYRSGYLKNNGREVEFETEAEAAAEAARLNEQMNGNPHRTANFRYTVEN